MINALALLGWNPPHQEDPHVVNKQIGAIAKHDVMDMRDLVETFDIYKIGKAPVKYDSAKLGYLN